MRTITAAHAQLALPFAAFAALLVMATALLPRLASDMQRAFAAGLALDFTILVPALVYLCLVRAKRLPLIGVVPAFIIGLVVATITAGPHAPRVIDALHLVALPVELAVVAVILLTARRLAKSAASGEGDFPTRFRAAARQALGARIPADILTTEVATLRYALGPAPKPAASGRGFTLHRRTAATTLMVGLSIAVAVETLALHLFIARWSHGAAWVLTGLSVYAMVWLLGDFRALRARRVTIDGDHLRLRIGLRWEADIPLAAIEHAERATRQLGDPKRDGELVCAVAGATSVRIVLREPVTVRAAYAIQRQAASIVTHLDEPDAFLEALTAARTP
ncbi:MAG: hypothetical protein ACF8QF_08955 [Phycisphaerales bacterium]